MTTESGETLPTNRAFNYRILRGLIGLIAITLAPIVAFISSRELGSISASYFTDARDVFVGSLFVVFAFLLAYGSRQERLEYGAAKLASISALCIAMFPTEAHFPGSKPPEYIQAFAALIGTTPPRVHFAAALCFFAMLFLMMMIFTIRAWRKNSKGRAVFYGFCLTGMVASVFFVIENIELSQNDYGAVFMMEFGALFFFGAGWFYSGMYRWTGDVLRKRKERRAASARRRDDEMTHNSLRNEDAADSN